MKYRCANEKCGKIYSEDRVPASGRCRECGNRLVEVTQVSIGTEASIAHTEENYVAETDFIKDAISFNSAKEHEGITHHYEEVKEQQVFLWEDGKSDRENIKQKETHFQDNYIPFDIENAKCEQQGNALLKTENKYDTNRVIGEIIASRSNIATGRNRRSGLEKLSNYFRYGQNMSDAYNEVDIETESGKRCTVVFYGDVTFGADTFIRNGNLEAEGVYRTENEFVANRIFVNNRAISISNRNRDRQEEQSTSERSGRRQLPTFLWVIIAILGLLFLWRMAHKISYIGLENSIVSLCLICVGIYVGLVLILNLLFPGRRGQENQTRAIRPSIILILLVAVIWVLI